MSLSKTVTVSVLIALHASISFPLNAQAIGSHIISDHVPRTFSSVHADPLATSTRTVTIGVASSSLLQAMPVGVRRGNERTVSPGIVALTSDPSGHGLRGAVIGGLTGAALGIIVIATQGDYSSCASDIGAGACRAGQVAIVVGAAALGALIGYVVGAAH